MGNKHGANTTAPSSVGGSDTSPKTKEAKSKDEKKREKEDKQRRKRERKEQEKQSGKRKRGGHRDDVDLDDSSHVTGGEDSESGVFHSAENVSVSPYLDSCTVSDLDQVSGGVTSSWSSSGAGTFEKHRQPGGVSSRLQQHEHHHQFQHPKILSSSRDFRDGFSLEACIPPEIARPERYHHHHHHHHPTVTNSSSNAAAIAEEGGGVSKSTTPFSGRLDRSKDGSGKSRRSNTSSNSSCHVTPTASRAPKDAASCSKGDGDGYSTPLLSTPVFSRAQRDRHSPSTSAQAYTPFTDPDESMDISTTSASSSKSSGGYNIFNHPFFYKGSLKKDKHQHHHSHQQQQLQQQQQEPHQQQQQHSSNRHLVPDYRNLPKPTSPHPQRRALSPKMTAAPFKMISSDDSSSSPTTPTPQRRAAALLNLLRPGGSKKGKDKEAAEKDNGSRRKLEQLTPDHTEDWRDIADIDTEASSSSDWKEGNEKRKPRWKTWERSSGPKKTSEKAKRVSIFGTSRKTGASKNKQGEKRRSSLGVDVVRPSSAAELSSRENRSSSRSGPSSSTLEEITEAAAAAIIAHSQATPPSSADHRTPPASRAEVSTVSATSSSSRRIKQPVASVMCHKTSRNSSRSSDSNLDCRTITPSASGGMNTAERNRASSSPPTVKSAAFCIMRLEELERAIERTIREKFPDAEPFILRKPSREEEIKGSRSLPTTPSLKKKRYVSREETGGDSGGSSRQSRNGDGASSNGDGGNASPAANDGAFRRGQRNGKNDSGKIAMASATSDNNNGACSDQSRNYDVMYESVPSPTMSPVILRRFGARTRHASISPKVPRAKTAALYNSPSEMSRVEESAASRQTPAASSAPKAVQTFSASTRAAAAAPATGRATTTSSKTAVSPLPLYAIARGEGSAERSASTLATSLTRCKANSSSNSDVNSVTMAPLSLAHKSTSKYDNVMDDEELPQYTSIVQASGRKQRANLPKGTERATGTATTSGATKTRQPNSSSNRLVRQQKIERTSCDGDYDNCSTRKGIDDVFDKRTVKQKETGCCKGNKKYNSQKGCEKSEEVGGGEMDSDEVEDRSSLSGADRGMVAGDDQRPVIVPTFSAVFGSVSPKLRRHLHAKKEEEDTAIKERGNGMHTDQASTSNNRGIQQRHIQEQKQPSQQEIQPPQQLQQQQLQQQQKQQQQQQQQRPKAAPNPSMTKIMPSVPAQKQDSRQSLDDNIAPNREGGNKAEPKVIVMEHNITRVEGTSGKTRKQPPLKSLSLDNSSQRSRQPGGSSVSPGSRLLAAPGSFKTSPIPSPVSQSHQIVPSNKTAVEAAAALSVKDRVRSLNKSVSEGWTTGPVNPTSPSSPPQPPPSPSVLSGPQPYPHFAPDRPGKCGAVKQLSLRHPAGSTSASLSPQAAALSPHRSHGAHPSLSPNRADFVVESATTLGLTSPGSTRKHSTDHVVFGSAVALPCRVYAQVSSPTSPSASLSPTSPPAPAPRSPAPRRQQQEEKRAYLEQASEPQKSAHARNTALRGDQRDARYAGTRDQLQNARAEGERGGRAEESEKDRKIAGEEYQKEKGCKSRPEPQHTTDFSALVPSDSSNTQSGEKSVLKTCASHTEDLLEPRSVRATVFTALKLPTPSDITKEARVSLLPTSQVSKHNVSSSDSKASVPVSKHSRGARSVHDVTDTYSVTHADSTSAQTFNSPVSSVKLENKRGEEESRNSGGSACELASKGQTSSTSGATWLDKDNGEHCPPVQYSWIKSGHPDNLQNKHQKATQEQQQQQEAEEQWQTIRQENVESPDAYKPSLRFVDVESKSVQRQPLSKVISDMISVSKQVSHEPLSSREQQPQHQQQQPGEQHQQQPQRRRRRQQPPEHHLHQQKKQLYFQKQQETQHKEPGQKSYKQEDKQEKQQLLPQHHHPHHQQQVQTDSQQPHQHTFANCLKQDLPTVVPHSAVSTSQIFLDRSVETLVPEAASSVSAVSESAQSQATCTRPAIRPVKCESREMQTDIVTKADKAVDSWAPPTNDRAPPINDPALALKRDGGGGDSEKGSLSGSPKQKPRNTNRTWQRTKNKGSTSAESDDDSENEFLKKVKSTTVFSGSSKTKSDIKQSIGGSSAASQQSSGKDDLFHSKQGVKGERGGVPPPSPTAMERLMQEMAEEESDEEEFERKEIEQAMRRESEMKEFTDKIYKRLSDLLCSHSGEDEIESNGIEEQREKETKEAGDMERKIGIASAADDDDDVFVEDRAASRNEKSVKNALSTLTGSQPSAYSEEERRKEASPDSDASFEGCNSDVFGSKSVHETEFEASASAMASSSQFEFEQESSLVSSYHAGPPRVLTIESSSSLTTSTSESESEEEETPVIIFQPPPSQQVTDLSRLRDYREDPELPTLLRRAIISRNMGGAALWDDDERSKARSPAAEDATAALKHKTEPNFFVFPERSVDFLERHSPDHEEKPSATHQHQSKESEFRTKSPQHQQQQHHQQQLLQQRRSSREYHSDDDVVAGRGVPDYYDDQTLWVTRRHQRPPVQFSQLSLAVVAQRRRERRERWLKKRRRNRTDLLSSTGGSSDTDREQHRTAPKPTSDHQATASQDWDRRPALQRRHFLSGSSLDAYEDNREEIEERNPHDMGSGILASPKYSKPIIPSFLGSAVSRDQPQADDSRLAAKIAAERLHYRHGEDDLGSNGDRKWDRNQEIDSDDIEDNENEGARSKSSQRREATEEIITASSQHQSHAGIPGIEETFNELKSVQNILEGLQDRRETSETKPKALPKSKPPVVPGASFLSPLTKENVRSLRDYDKTGSNRRSRMSLTDRTESDLDLYSERGPDDDCSSGSEYADDEGEGENGEDEETCYNTAEDDLDCGDGARANRRPISGLTASDTSTNRKSGNLSDDSETDFVVSCTFYNSSVYPPPSGAAAGGVAASLTGGGGGGLSTLAGGLGGITVVPSSSSGTSSRAVMATTTTSSEPTANVASSTPISASRDGAWITPQRLQQQQQPQQPPPSIVVTAREGAAAAAPTRSTFQSARHQMHDIQTHLQALRRQMEVLPDDDDDEDVGDITAETMTTSTSGSTVYRQ